MTQADLDGDGAVDAAKTDMELSEDEDMKCLSPDDGRGPRPKIGLPVSPSPSYCEPPLSDEDPLTPTPQTDSLPSSPYGGYVPPILPNGRTAVPDRGGRQTEIITEI